MNNRGGLTVYCGCTLVVDAEYDYESDTSASRAIISALAEAVGVEPTELPPLFNYVDPDALNALFEPSDGFMNGDTFLSFSVDTWNIFVRSDGRIRICDATQPIDPKPVFESTTI